MNESSANQAFTPVIKKDEFCTYFIGGVEVFFPYKAYPSQLAMMDKIIKSVAKKQNCLLESPTGSGKSLALLCAALAWQQKFKKEMSDLIEKLELETIQTSEVEIDNSYCPDTSYENIYVPENNESANNKPCDLQNFRFTPGTKRYRSEVSSYFNEEDDDFKPTKSFKRLNFSDFSPADGVYHKLGNECSALPTSSKSVTNPISSENTPQKIEHNKICKSPCKESMTQSVIEKVPKIYFGTRTHKQITQIIRELKKTVYRKTKMTILSSRDRTCIHPTLSNLNGKKRQEGCDEMLSAPGGPECTYYRNHKSVKHDNPYKLSQAWDIEDLINSLKRVKCCPYFSARALVGESDIVFCPYNYLVDPLIRSSLDISLDDSIVIMDEAHNIEDSAREAASCSIDLIHIADAIADLLRKIPTRQSKVSYNTFVSVLNEIKTWLQESEKFLQSSNMFEPSSKVYAGQDMIAILLSFGAGQHDFEMLNKCFKSIQNEESDITSNKDRQDEFKLAGATLQIVKSLLLVLDFIYREDKKYLQDYRCVILKKKQWHSSPAAKRNAKTEISINFWCLNPAVAFSDIKGTARNIIVTSGTLSPMASFQSELDLPFEIKLETNHVVSRNQMWVGTIGKGPKGSVLSATYANTETFHFQDEIGNLLLQICLTIPYGVLCFLPSYSMLDKLTARWQTTDVWEHILEKKVIVCEPRGQSQNFDAVMNEFYDAVKNAETDSNYGVNGALFIAVCRGKASEGLDFADNNARAVITIGIPFPNIRDFQIDLKKKYNNSLCSVSGIMSGNDWYQTQAFRALNQALGRCIRHRNDFGALIIVDDRFQKQMGYVNSLSKWIRKEVVHYQSFDSALTSLKGFAERTGLLNSSAVVPEETKLEQIDASVIE